MKNNIRKKFINLLLLEINKFNKHKKDKRGCVIKYSNKLILSIIIDKFILGITWRQTKDIKTNDNDIRYNTIYYGLNYYTSHEMPCLLLIANC